MEILVLVKQTFDTEEKIQLSDGHINDDGVELIINPYDEYALEEGIRLKEEVGAEVTALTIGKEEAEQALRTALAMGADNAILVEVEDKIDELALAKVIVAAVDGKQFDLILGGNMSIDNGAGQVALRVAQLLNIPHVASITKLTIDGDMATVERDAEGDIEILSIPLPFVATAQQGLNEPRYPSLPGIMKAKKKPLERIELDDLDLDEEALKNKTETITHELPAKKQAGKVLQGEIDQQVTELVSLLRTEAKVI